MSDRWAMIRNGTVENVCLWDGSVHTWQPPADVEMRLAPEEVGIGWLWDGAKFQRAPRNLAAEWDLIRIERNRRLAASDFTQLLDAPFDATKKNEWRVYRQALRDITTQPDPITVVWPVQP